MQEHTAHGGVAAKRSSSRNVCRPLVRPTHLETSRSVRVNDTVDEPSRVFARAGAQNFLNPRRTLTGIFGSAAAPG